MIKPLNDLFTKAVNYKTYRLECRSARYNAEVARHISRIRKKLDVQMKSHTFSGQDPIAVLGFVARFKMACDHKGVSQGDAVWCFQLYLTGQAHALLQSRLMGNAMAVDAEQRDMLESYEEVVNFLLRTYATDETIAEAYTEVVSFRQSSNMTEEAYRNQLWDKALRCGTVFSDRRLKSLYVEGLLPATCDQVRNYLATDATVDYQAVARYAQAIGETHRSARRHLLPSNVASRDATGMIAFNRSGRKTPVLSVESSSEAAYTGASPNADGIFAMTSPTVHASTVGSPPTSFHPSPVPSVGGAVAPTSTVAGYGRRFGSGDQCARWGPPPCWFCLDPTHRLQSCPVVADASLRAQLLAAMEANYQKLRTRQGLRPGSPFSRPQGPVWRGNSSSQTTPVNLVDEEADGAEKLIAEE